jgi:magnesium chelatase family protein
MSTKLLHLYCTPDRTGEAILKNAMEKLGLSAMAYYRILKVARTIADLEGVENIHPDHLSEAIQFRSLDREGCGA